MLIEEVGLALRNALFEEGLDIGRPEVIGSMAARFDLEPPLDAETTSVAVQADWGAGRARGVVGSPHFFTEDGADWFCPGLAISRDDVGNFIVAWKVGAEAFVDRVFTPA